MGSATSLLTQSKYYLPVFNMAIFDGPFRLYFAQSQESEALRMYFELHEILGEKIRPPRAGAIGDRALFVMIYPDEVAFEKVFASKDEIAETWIGEASVVGIKGPVWRDDVLDRLISRIEEIFDSTPVHTPRAFAEL